MARLRALPPLLRAPPPVLSAPVNAHRHSKTRDKDRPYHKWYKTARWQKLRWQVLMDASFICAMCGRGESDTSKMVCDHIRAHRGDPALFWSRENLQRLCKTPCHDSVKQREERGDWG